jgi:uncharacterized protein YkwD
MFLTKVVSPCLLLSGSYLVLADPIRFPRAESGLDGLLEAARSPDVTIVTGEPEIGTALQNENVPLGEVSNLEHTVRRQALSADQTEALRLHNNFRSTKSLKSLIWDATLTKYAQEWADYLAQTSQMVHSKPENRTGQGENLAYAW